MRRGGRVLGIVALVLAVAGCRGPRPEVAPPKITYDEAFFGTKPFASFVIPTPRAGAKEDTVVGEVKTVTVRDGDTLLDIARLHDVGYEEIKLANPGVDPWVPPVGATVLVPTAFVLPCCTYEGVVINVPELRMFYYRPGPTPGTTRVETYPVGLGRTDYRTPMGVFRVAGKTVNPVWGVPERIRAEHIKERGDARRFIKGGDPDNPLGKYRIELDRTLYRIHGTNFPWGIGKLVSHGCVQLYPEDIARLFPLVPVGTRVEFAYQPVKVGRRAGKTWVEAHPDIYKRGRSPKGWAVAALRQQGLSADPAHLQQALDGGRGEPRAVPVVAPKGSATPARVPAPPPARAP